MAKAATSNWNQFSTEHPSTKAVGRADLISNLLLGVILVSGAALRFSGLSIQSLWHDELSTWFRTHYDTLYEVWNKGVLQDIHPPAYHLVMYVAQRLLGDSEMALRLPSAFFGTLSLWLVFLIGKRLFSKREGIIAAAIMAVAQTPLYYSQEVRSYALLLCIVQVVFLCWYAIANALVQGKRPPLGPTLSYIVLGAFAGYIHYFGLFFTLFLALWTSILFLGRWRAWFSFVFIYMGVGLLFAPWLPFMAYQSQALSGNAEWIQEKWLALPFGELAWRMLRFYFSDADLDARSDLLLFLALGVVAAGGVAALVRWRQQRRLSDHAQGEVNAPNLSLHPDMFLVFMAVVPFLISYAISLTLSPILTDRNMIIALPMVYLLVARSITRLSDMVSFPNAGAFVLTAAWIGIFAYHLFFVINYYSEPHKEQYREAVAYLAANQAKYPNSIIVGGVSTFQREYFNYYLEKLGSKRRVTVLGGKPEHAERIAETLLKKQPQYIWFLAAHKNPDKEIIRFLDKVGDFQFKQNFRRSTVRLYIFEPNKLR